MLSQIIKLSLLSSLLLFYSFQDVSAQSSSQLIYKERLAMEALTNYNYASAIEIYQELDSLKPDTPGYQYGLGVSYINLHKHKKALPYLEKCLNKPKNHPDELYYYGGKAYHLHHNMDQAIANYEKFISALEKKMNKKNRLDIRKIISEVEREVKMCEFGKRMIDNPLEVKIVNLGEEINSPYPEYAPVISADESEIIFTSTRPGSTGGEIDESDGLGLHYEDIYISSKTDSGWSTPRGLGPHVNSPGNDASVALTADGHQLIFYRSVKENFLSRSSGDLYLSDLKGTEWTEAKKLSDKINSKAWEPSACFSSDGRTLYFVSNRDDGYGGTDIYVIKKLPNGEWAEPYNIGDQINTRYDEDSPYMHPDGKTLYFCSKGHETMGGYDVFVTTYNENTRKWSKPRNVGYPISTAHDDIHFSWSADGQRVYFSSIRPEGQGDKDLYYGQIKQPEANLVVMKGFITDSTSQTPMEARIIVRDQDTGELIGIFHSNSATGKYLVVLPEGKHYEFSIEAENYYECTTSIEVPDLTGFEVLERDIQLCSVQRKESKSSEE